MNIYFDGEKQFDINASGTNVALQGIESSENAESVNSADSATLKGKITVINSSIITTALDGITASIDLNGNATLEAKNIMLDSTNNSISLSGTSTLTADKISVKDVSNFNLTQETGANFNVKNISLEKSTLEVSTLTFNAESSIITSDSNSKLQITKLKVTNGNLTLTLADSANNAQKLNTIDISNNGSVSFYK